MSCQRDPNSIIRKAIMITLYYTCLIVAGSRSKLTMFPYFHVFSSSELCLSFLSHTSLGPKRKNSFVASCSFFQTTCTMCWIVWLEQNLFVGLDDCPVHGRSWKDWSRPLFWCHTARGRFGDISSSHEQWLHIFFVCWQPKSRTVPCTPCYALAIICAEVVNGCQW